MDILQLSSKISAVCPIDGVSIGRKNDKSSWRIDYKQEATDEQRAAAQAIVAAFDADAETVPQSVTPYQARMALLGVGLLSSVDTLMGDPSTPQAAKLAWEYATQIYRDSAFIEALAPALGLTDAQIDALFVAAGKVN